jgi:hypothetical protein
VLGVNQYDRREVVCSLGLPTMRISVEGEDKLISDVGCGYFVRIRLQSAVHSRSRSIELKRLKLSS